MLSAKCDSFCLGLKVLMITCGGKGSYEKSIIRNHSELIPRMIPSIMYGRALQRKLTLLSLIALYGLKSSLTNFMAWCHTIAGTLQIYLHNYINFIFTKFCACITATQGDKSLMQQVVNSTKLTQNSHKLTDTIFKVIFSENCYIKIQIALKFASRDPINNVIVYWCK